MEDAAQPSLEDVAVQRCPRCLQPVPQKATRCPQCRQPLHSHRRLPLTIGAAGLLVLLLALVLMVAMMRNEDKVQAPAPVDEGAAKQSDPFDLPPPVDSKHSKPEKPPPLNEK